MKSCDWCEATFTPHRSHKAQRFCGAACAQRSRRAAERSALPPRQCEGCGEPFPATTHLRRYCSRDCWHKNYRKRKPARWHHIAHRYGLEQADVEAMLVAQDNKCAICVVELTGSAGEPSAPNIDHDHETGQVRAILCKPCNIALGHLRDDPAIVASALDYLLRWRAATEAA